MHVYVDSIEENSARVLLGEEEQVVVFIPRSWLPESVSEGEWLSCVFERDDAFTELQREKIRELMDSLGDEP